MKTMLAPSMMCAPIDKLALVLDTFEKCGIEYLHVDVMDGVFVPNLMLGTEQDPARYPPYDHAARKEDQLVRSAAWRICQRALRKYA